MTPPNPPNATSFDELPLVRVAGRMLRCLVCDHHQFLRREVSMNTAGMSFMGLDWANKKADGAVCRECGFVHAFMGGTLTWLRAETPVDEP